MKLFVVLVLLASIYFLLKWREGTKSKGPIPEAVLQRDDKDTWEGNFWDTRNQISVCCSFRIEYSDSDGQATTREIEVKKMGDFGPDKLIMAHCKLRNSTRTFLMSRIKNCVDLSSGEVVDPLNHLQELYRNSPAYVIDLLHENHMDFIRVLLYCAKADGAVRKKERQIFIASCNDLVGSSLLDDESFSALIKSVEVPSMQAFKLAVGRIANNKDGRIDLLVTAMTQMVESEKTISAPEREALDYVMRKLGK